MTLEPNGSGPTAMVVGPKPPSLDLQRYVNKKAFGLFWMALGYCFTYFWAFLDGFGLLFYILLGLLDGFGLLFYILFGVLDAARWYPEST